MAKSRLNLGLVGAGRIGRLHAEHLRCRIPESNLVIVADVNGQAAADCANRFGVPEHGDDYRKVLAHPDVDAVVICSSTDTHSELIHAAANAGKHIFCEKPLETELARIDAALAAVAKAGVLLQVGFNRRFDSNFKRVRQAVVKGEIGTPHQVRITSRDPGPPPIEYVRKSGGMFMDMTIHDFDMARYLVGEEVTEVYVAGGVRVDPAIGAAGDIDTATILLKFAGGAVGVIENCRRAVYGYDQRVEVFGSGGAVSVDNNFPNTAVLSLGSSIARDLPLNFFMDRYVESYLQEMREFVRAALDGTQPPVTGQDARPPVAMAKAARMSLDLNRPVKLSEVE